MNVDKAIKLIESVGLFGLAPYDGCLCTSCSIQGFNIDLSCRKSGGSHLPFFPEHKGHILRVYSHSLDNSISDSKLVADAVMKDLVDSLGENPEYYIIRMCDYESDRDLSCVWCSKPRGDASGYYCDEHKDRR